MKKRPTKKPPRKTVSGRKPAKKKEPERPRMTDIDPQLLDDIEGTLPADNVPPDGWYIF